MEEQKPTRRGRTAKAKEAEVQTVPAVETVQTEEVVPEIVQEAEAVIKPTISLRSGSIDQMTIIPDQVVAGVKWRSTAHNMHTFPNQRCRITLVPVDGAVIDRVEWFGGANGTTKLTVDDDTKLYYEFDSGTSFKLNAVAYQGATTYSPSAMFTITHTTPIGALERTATDPAYVVYRDKAYGYLTKGTIELLDSLVVTASGQPEGTVGASLEQQLWLAADRQPPGIKRNQLYTMHCILVRYGEVTVRDQSSGYYAVYDKGMWGKKPEDYKFGFVKNPQQPTKSGPEFINYWKWTP